MWMIWCRLTTDSSWSFKENMEIIIMQKMVDLQYVHYSLELNLTNFSFPSQCHHS